MVLEVQEGVRKLGEKLLVDYERQFEELAEKTALKEVLHQILAILKN